MIRWVLVVAIGVALAGSAVAKDNAQPDVVKDVPTFLHKQAELRDAIQHSKKYAHVKPDAKRKIFAAQDRLETLLKGHQSVDELDKDAKIEVFNAQTEIVAQLDGAEADRVICTNEAKTGSHLSNVVCTTKRERDEQREVVRRMYQTDMHRDCLQGVTCSGGG